MIFKSPHPAVPVPDVSFSTFLFGDIESRAGRPAIIEGPTGRILTYQDLRDDASAAALGLVSRGLEPGDLVAILSPNVPEYAVAFHAVASAGGCSTTLNPLQLPAELVHQVSDSRARWLVTAPELARKATEVASATGIEEVFVLGEADGATPFADLMDAGRRDRALAAAHGGCDPFDALERRVADPATHLVTLPYSSGTTGLPKGVMLTHRNLVANVSQYLVADPVAEGEVVLAVLPFFHIYGMVVVMSACLAAGATIVTMPRFDLESFLVTIAEYRIDRAYVVPPIILALAKHPLVDEHDISCLTRVFSGAAPLGAEVAGECERRLGCVVSQGYGLTEASPVTHLLPVSDRGPGRIGTVGPSLPDTEVCIVHLETGERLSPGQEGEVWIRGPQVMAGYLNRPAATAETVDADGWLHTGDVGRVDADGFLTIVDRAKELIKYKGYQVAPAELEAVLLGHAAIHDVAVIPSPDPEAGEVPKAFVVSSGHLTEEEVVAFVAERVAPYKRVRLVEFIDQIPKSPSGKILRRLLVDRERERLASELPV